ncbi:MAG: cytochrome c oxidase accessory protein CcoG [Gemmatimonadetes bacterium]|nr:cytochrome c oxidase accessory protein CcoG [Gemmatimonadota bacterium]
MLRFQGTRNWVYPLWIDGRFQRLRRWAFLALHLILFLTPWISIGGNQALRFDLQERRLYAFGAIFTASDTLLLLFLLLFLAFSLFFFTSLYGRLWCGYACPQTVFLEAWVRPIERWLEGERATRMRRDQGPWTAGRALRKAAKWALFLVAAFIVSMAFMSYFAGARELWTGRAGPVEYTLVGIFTVAWFWDFAWFREQFCNFLCPYARFQSVLQDPDTLTISYDPARGEPRGADAKKSGRCIDCKKCVVVCPAGIDIRNGFQLECIGCAACIDACDSVMTRLGHRSLVVYGTLNQLQGKPTRRLQVRTVVYAALLLALAVATGAVLATRVPFEASVGRAPGSLYTLDDDGRVRNTFLLRIANNTASADSVAFQLALELEGLPDAELIAPEVKLAPEEGRLVPLVVRVRAHDVVARTIPLRLRVRSPLGERVLATTFKSGGESGEEERARAEH